MTDIRPIVTELEVGPHYITVYGHSRAAMIALAPTVYNWLPRSIPELMYIQQKDLTHVANDPKVYHPNGEPDEIGKRDTAHFHVRYGRQPNVEDGTKLLSAIGRFVDFGDVIHTVLVPPKDYPEMDWENDTGYLLWIDKLRNGPHE